MKSPTTTLTTTIAALAISAVMVLACSSTDSNETTEQQSRATQPIATIQTNSLQAPQEDQPTKEVNPKTGSKTSSGLPNTANTGRENATIERPQFGTATPNANDPVATPTQPLRQQQGGAVILAQPTPTITPVPTPTSTPLPPSTPYWKQFSQAEYDQFRPPAGPIDWQKADKCQRNNTNNRGLSDATTSGILDRIEWGYTRAPTSAGDTLRAIRKLHPDLFPQQEWRINNLCGSQAALHPQIPVIRITFAMNVDSGTWIDPETGTHYTIWKAYRIEARYIYIQDEAWEQPKFEQLGPVLIEPLGHVCNRDDIGASWDDPMCKVPLD